jgi:hypothetical protein
VSGDPQAPVIAGRIGQALSPGTEFPGSDGSTCLISPVQVELASA